MGRQEKGREVGRGNGQGLPVFDLEEVVEEICGEGEEEDEEKKIVAKVGGDVNEAEVHLDHCWRNY